MTRPGIPALEAFIAVAKHQSFSKAAAERGVSPSALSHVIRGLEQTFDVRLFNRTNRSMRITAAGEHLLKRVGPALCDIVEAFEQVSQFKGRPSGTLRLNVPRNAIELVIKPMMADFLAMYPEITLEVVSDDGFVDIVAGGFDAGIRAAPYVAKDMIVVPVGRSMRFAVVGSPAYFQGRDRPRTPHDLSTHVCLRRRYPSGTLYRWLFARDKETVDVEVSGPLIVDDRSLIISAALDGVGLAHVHEVFAAEYVERGELVRVLQDWCPPLLKFNLYYPGRRQVPAPLRAFIDAVRTPDERSHTPG